MKNDKSQKHDDDHILTAKRTPSCSNNEQSLSDD